MMRLSCFRSNTSFYTMLGMANVSTHVLRVRADSVVVVLEDLLLVVFLGVVQDHRVLPPEPLRMHFGLHFGWRTQ